MFPDTAWARIGAALMDAILDLGYILTYLGMAPWKKLQRKSPSIPKHFSDKFTVSHCKSSTSRHGRLQKRQGVLCWMSIDAVDSCCLEGGRGHDALEGKPGSLGQFRLGRDVAVQSLG